MKWNDISNEDTRSSQKGYICEYDDLSDILDDGGKLIMSDPPETEEDDDWTYTLQEKVEEDPYYKDLKDGRYAIQSHWRGVQIKYPGSYFADANGDVLYVYDGDAMYVYATNITKAAEDDDRNLEAFCLERAEEQALSYFTELYGAPTNMDGIKREGGKVFHVDVTNAPVEQDITTIRMNVRDFDEAYKMLVEKGFTNAQGGKITNIGSSKSTMMVSSSGFSISIAEHIRNHN